MSSLLACEIVTPEERIFSGKVYQVIIPSTNGSFGVLPGHEMLACRMKKNGVVKVIIDEKSVDVKEFASYKGYAEVNCDRVLILARKAKEVSNIDAAQVKEKLEQAQKQLSQVPDRYETREEEVGAKVEQENILNEIEWLEGQLKFLQNSSRVS